MKYILTLDQGTTSSRAILFDKKGRIAGDAQQEFTQIFPRPGWVEHDPLEIWSSQLAVARTVVKANQVSPADVAAIGIANQRETTVVWDRSSGEPIYNAIVWQDRRTADRCRELTVAGHDKLIRQRSGLVTDAYFSASKIEWILDHVEGARKRAERGELAFGTIDTWLLWNLTGGNVHATDVSNASRTMIFNIHQLTWDKDLLTLFNIPDNILPDVRTSSEIYGESNAEVFGGPIRIAGMAGDQQAALFGQGCTRPGMVKNTYGTGCFLMLNTGSQARQSQNNLLTTIAWKIGDELQYALEGSIFIAGAVVQWLRDGLGIIHSSSEVEALAKTVEDNGGVYLVPAFAGLGAPHWDPYARGSLHGLTRGSHRGHIARAALESIAYQTLDIVEAMQADSGIKISELRVDGGATINNTLMQFQADIMETIVVRPAIHETTALGAAYLAGLAVGFWKDQAEIEALWQRDATFSGSADREKIDTLIRNWRRAVERSKAWEQSEENV